MKTHVLTCSFLFCVASSHLAQVEEYVINAVSALTKDSSFADHTHFQGKAMSLIKNAEMEVLRSIYHTKKFGSFTKMMYQDSIWIGMSIGQTDSLIEAFIEEVRL